MSVPQITLPSYLYHSPVGIHIRDFPTFMASNCPAPLSNDPEKASWASDLGEQHPFRQMFAPTPSGAESFNLLIYNKSRDHDRICPSCRRWYRVGESEHFYGSYDEFVARGFPSAVPEEWEEQDLSGICSRACMEAMVQDPEERAANDIAANAGRYEREMRGYVMRRTTAQEQVTSDVQFVWEKRTASAEGRA